MPANNLVLSVEEQERQKRDKQYFVLTEYERWFGHLNLDQTLQDKIYDYIGSFYLRYPEHERTDFLIALAREAEQVNCEDGRTPEEEEDIPIDTPLSFGEKNFGMDPESFCTPKRRITF